MAITLKDAYILDVLDSAVIHENLPKFLKRCVLSYFLHSRSFSYLGYRMLVNLISIRQRCELLAENVVELWSEVVGCVIVVIVRQHLFVVFVTKLSKVCSSGAKDARMVVILFIYARGFVIIDYVRLDVVTLVSIERIVKLEEASILTPKL